MDFSKTSILFLFCTYLVHCSEKPIPAHLVDCYKQPGPMLLPFTVNTLIEIVQKTNFKPFTPVSLAQQAADLLHWFSVEGLERDPNIVLNEKYVVPLHRSQFQDAKQDLIMKKLISVKRRTFDAYSLSLSEKCTLHFMMSSTIDFWERCDEITVCPNSYQEFRGSESKRDGARYSSCPIERGVVLTQAGSVNVARVVRGVAAALAPQTMAVSQQTTAVDSISSIWAATLAGDLAEAAVLQAPLYNDVYIGLAGRWNDTYIPSLFYFSNVPYSIITRHNWQVTDAKVLGSMDGLLVGRAAVNLKTEMPGLQLSQLLDMYYNRHKIDWNVCSREASFRAFIGSNEQELVQQTQRFADLIETKTLHYSINKSVRKQWCNQIVEKFMDYYPSLFGSKECVQDTVPQMLDLTIVLDATWTTYSYLQFIVSLMDQVDISHYGGQLAIINGDSYHVQINSTSSPISVYQQLVQSKSEDPTGLVLGKSLLAVKKRVEDNNKREQELEHFRRAQQEVVFIIGYSSSISDKDLKTSKELLSIIKIQNPAVRFVYWSSHVNAPRFVPLTAVPNSQLDTILTTDHPQLDLILPRLQYTLRSARTLKPGYCKADSHQWPESSYEEYILPSETITYWIHPRYLCDSLDIVKISFHNYDYGELRVCMSRDEEEVGDCQEVGRNQEITHALLRPCRPSEAALYQWDPGCPPIYLSVSVTQTSKRCTEYDCRYPDQVKFTIIVQDLHCINLNSPVCSVASLLMSSISSWALLIVLKLF